MIKNSISSNKFLPISILGNIHESLYYSRSILENWGKTERCTIIANQQGDMTHQM